MSQATHQTKIHAVILAAGYATRLYPLTINQPKPLLHVAGRPMLDHILDHLLLVEEIEKIHFVLNDKFAGHFSDWHKNSRSPLKSKFNFINDGSKDESDKLGAIGDLYLAITNEKINSDIVVLAGDNIFSKSIAGFFDHCLNLRQPVLGTYDLNDLEKIKKYSSISTDPGGRIAFFEEKPEKPKSSLIGIGLYYYPKETLALIKQYKEEGNNPDQPGQLVQWMYKRVPFHTWQVPGAWFDIGSKETLEEADRLFSAKDRRSSLALEKTV